MSRQLFTNLNELTLRFKLGGFHTNIIEWGYFDGSEWWRNYFHVHSYFEICYVIGGEGIFKIHGETYELGEGDLFIAKPGEEHEIIASTEKPLAIFFWSYTLVPQTVSHDELSILFNTFVTGKMPLVKNQHHHLSILDLLTAEASRKAIGYTFMVNTLAQQLIIETARAATLIDYTPVQSDKQSHHQIMVNTVIRYLQDNITQTLSVKKLAAQVYISERQLSRIFKTLTGTNITAYSTDLKITLAKNYLLSSAKPIEEIATTAGFSDVRYFSKTFKKSTGLSPALFRKKKGTIFL